MWADIGRRSLGGCWSSRDGTADLTGWLCNNICCHTHHSSDSQENLRTLCITEIHCFSAASCQWWRSHQRVLAYWWIALHHGFLSQIMVSKNKLAIHPSLPHDLLKGSHRSFYPFNYKLCTLHFHQYASDEFLWIFYPSWIDFTLSQHIQGSTLSFKSGCHADSQASAVGWQN